VARDKIAGRHGRTHGFANAYAEFLPYRSGTFALVVSSLTYQWLENWRTAFRESSRVFRPGGFFCFSTLGSGTLCELKDSYRRSYQARGNGGSPALHRFVRQDDLRDMLADGGFAEVTVQGRLEREYHADVKQLLIGLKAIGAQNGSQNRKSGMGRPGVFRGMIDAYEQRYRDAEGIPATYELLFGFGRKVVCTSI